MSFPDVNDVSTAYSLCTCNGHCSPTCAVCASPKWTQEGCVRALFEELPYRSPEDMAASMPIGKPGIPERRNPQLPPDPETVEKCIDFMEERGIPLLPWQAAAFRAIMNGDGKPFQFRGRK